MEVSLVVGTQQMSSPMYKFHVFERKIQEKQAITMQLVT